MNQDQACYVQSVETRWVIVNAQERFLTPQNHFSDFLDKAVLYPRKKDATKLVADIMGCQNHPLNQGLMVLKVRVRTATSIEVQS